MKIGVKLNQLTYQDYIYILKRYQKYTDFNSVALYRSIIENDKLDLPQKIAIRELAHEKFIKTFEFLQVKDPHTYIKVSMLGETLTQVEEAQLWQNIFRNQEKILKKKRIKHRNFGVYSRHNCDLPECPYNGMMVRQDCSHHCLIGDRGIHFDTDKRSRWKLTVEYGQLSKYAERRSAEKRAFKNNKRDWENQLMGD
jgi:hypothetical protein